MSEDVQRGLDLDAIGVGGFDGDGVAMIERGDRDQPVARERPLPEAVELRVELKFPDQRPVDTWLYRWTA